jgi:hypothetical protein
MNSTGKIIVIAVLGIAGIVVAGVSIGLKIKEKAALKTISEDSGLPVEEVKRRVKQFQKELKAMAKNGASKDRLLAETLKFYSSFEPAN